MSWLRTFVLSASLLLSASLVTGDVMVQLNINRPINDVSDKFVSFTIKPEDLYKALDGSNRKTITRMASMLSNSHVKFVGDFYFAAKTEGIRLRNPTKIVWKGFNKWTKAVNWTMIIPVPYKPDNWDPMPVLKILNTAHMLDIDEAIWQLGTDFGSCRAADYVSELKTFNIMIDSFKQSVMSWQSMGADISAGSSAEETRRYVEMSRDLNVAYGWIQSDDMFSSNNLGSTHEDKDPALKVLLKSNVPVWLSLPKKKVLSTRLDDEVLDGLNWAQTMGDAATVGFETIFKPLTIEDFEKPKYGFYVTALFKKIMGSRVYPARPLALFAQNNKLYTHCANMVSGGLAFMVVNKQEQPLQIAVRSTSLLQDSEVWQYTLTMTNGHILLNNRKLYLNSTLLPDVRRKQSKSILQLRTPGLSVSFWVLPHVNLEHCHFTEVESPIMPADENNQKFKRYSSTDRLLKELIKEANKPPLSPLASLITRHRRSVPALDERPKRFVLEGAKQEAKKPLGNFAESFMPQLSSPFKRDIFSPERRLNAMTWLSNIFKEPLTLDLPLLKRNARQSDLYTGPFFMTRDGRKTAFKKKISEIKKPVKKIEKASSENEEFDEEKFFKNIKPEPEPEYVRIPEGDVFLSNIASANSEEQEPVLKIETKKPSKPKNKVKATLSEVKPLRLLPTEFFEALPASPVQPFGQPLNIGSALNSLLFADPFGQKQSKPKTNAFGKEQDLKEDPITTEIVEPELHKDLDIDVESNSEDDFLKAQIDMTQKNLSKKSLTKAEEEAKAKEVEDLLDADEEKNPNFLTPDTNYFGEAANPLAEEESENPNKSLSTDSVSTTAKFEELPWWDLSNTRLRRSLDLRYPDDSWRINMISKDDDPIAAANELSPIRLHQFEHKVEEVVRNANNKDDKTNEVPNDEVTGSIGQTIVKTFKEQVTKFVDMFSQHVSEWYKTFTKQFDNTLEDSSPTEISNRVV